MIKLRLKIQFFKIYLVFLHAKTMNMGRKIVILLFSMLVAGLSVAEGNRNSRYRRGTRRPRCRCLGLDVEGEKH